MQDKQVPLIKKFQITKVKKQLHLEKTVIKCNHNLHG